MRNYLLLCDTCVILRTDSIDTAIEIAEVEKKEFSQLKIINTQTGKQEWPISNL